MRARSRHDILRCSLTSIWPAFALISNLDAVGRRSSSVFESVTRYLTLLAKRILRYTCDTLRL